MKIRPISIVAALLVLSASGADFTTASFTWDPNPETNIAGYKVQWGTTNSGTGYTKTVTTNFVTIQFTNSVPHWLNVIAFNTAGLQSRPSSNLLVDIPASPAGGRVVAWTTVSTTVTNWIVVP